MKFSTVLFTVAAASVSLVAAQNTTTTSDAPAPTWTSSYPKEVVDCLDGCGPGDVRCQAKCLGNPRPDEEAVIKTNECAGKCEQGNGTEAETQLFANCVAKCVNEHFWNGENPANGGSVGGGSGSGSGSGSGNNNGNNNNNDDDGDNSNETGGSSTRPTDSEGNPSPTGDGDAAQTSEPADSGAASMIASWTIVLGSVFAAAAML